VVWFGAGILPDLNPTDSERNLDLHWAAHAIELARQADYWTSPNPMVGAVVLDADGLLAGEGYHREAGHMHAEEEALAAAGDRARGGTVYVNLEPCSHEHRSPSCAQAIVAAGVRRVVASIAYFGVTGHRFRRNGPPRSESSERQRRSVRFPP